MHLKKLLIIDILIYFYYVKKYINSCILLYFSDLVAIIILIDNFMKATFSQQFKTLIKKHLLNYLRNKNYIK